jgi:hypothetical protein
MLRKILGYCSWDYLWLRTRRRKQTKIILRDLVRIARVGGRARDFTRLGKKSECGEAGLTVGHNIITRTRDSLYICELKVC